MEKEDELYTMNYTYRLCVFVSVFEILYVKEC